MQTLGKNSNRWFARAIGLSRDPYKWIKSRAGNRILNALLPGDVKPVWNQIRSYLAEENETEDVSDFDDDLDLNMNGLAEVGDEDQFWADVRASSGVSDLAETDAEEQLHMATQLRDQADKFAKATHTTPGSLAQVDQDAQFWSQVRDTAASLAEELNNGGDGEAQLAQIASMEAQWDQIKQASGTALAEL